MPTNASDALRRLIEALFITHTEAQLNTDGHLDKLLFPNEMFQSQSGCSQQNPWCKHLVRRPNSQNT